MKAKALVTGACGFIGSHLVDQLVEDGVEVRATDLPFAPRHWLRPDVPFVPADLTDPATLVPAIQGVDIVFHVAAIFDFSAPWERLYRVNVLGTDNLCYAAQKAGVGRIISWSSYGVYGRFNKSRFPIDETHPVRPKDNYGRSKAMQDAVIWRYHDQGLPGTIVRPSAPYGPRARYGMADVFLHVSRAPVIPVPVNLRNRMMAVHVKDVARAASFLAQREGSLGQEYNITDDSHYTYADFVRFLASALGKRTIPVYVPRPLLKSAAWTASLTSEAIARLRATRPLLEKDTVYYLTFDFFPTNEKIKAIGFRFLYPDTEQGVREVIAELRKEGSLA
jgi:nucleoside-diphosphate-sugar epimerase